MERKRLKGQRSLLRARLNFTPEYNDIIRKWTYRFAIKNLWKVTPLFDLDDLIGESMLVFWEVAKKYPEVSNERHFFSLYACSFRNRIIRHAQARQYKVGVAESALTSDENGILDRFAARPESDPVYNLLRDEAPEPVRKLLKALDPEHEGDFADARLEVLSQKASIIDGRIVRPSRRESVNERLCRIIGEDPERLDLVSLVLHWIQPAAAH